MIENLELRRIISIGILFAFLGQGLVIPQVQAQDFRLPAPGVMVPLSPEFNPPILKGIKVHPDNPFRFDFILDKGDSQLSNNALKDESSKLIKYFLASLTIPEKDLWVNLSPYEKDRIIPNSFGLTGMGRDLLAEDYMLKQITASLIYPEDEIGKKFWKRIYEVAEKRFGTTNVPVNTFNKVWIVPEKAVVYENAKAGTAYVVESKLKVMLEQDYLSLQKHEGISSEVQVRDKATNQLGSQIVREIVIPQLTKEVNEDKNFSQLRQVYNSLILATWYKKKIKDNILEQVYADKNKVAGVNIDDPQEKQKIYERYLQAFKKGVYNYIKQDFDPATQETIPRKYFSGGLDMAMTFSNYSLQSIAFQTIRDAAAIVNAPDRQIELKITLMGVDQNFYPTERKIRVRLDEQFTRNVIKRVRKGVNNITESTHTAYNGNVSWPFLVNLDEASRDAVIRNFAATLEAQNKYGEAEIFLREAIEKGFGNEEIFRLLDRMFTKEIENRTEERIMLLKYAETEKVLRDLIGRGFNNRYIILFLIDMLDRQNKYVEAKDVLGKTFGRESPLSFSALVEESSGSDRGRMFDKKSPDDYIQEILSKVLFLEKFFKFGAIFEKVNYESIENNNKIVTNLRILLGKFEDISTFNNLLEDLHKNALEGRGFVARQALLTLVLRCLVGTSNPNLDVDVLEKVEDVIVHRPELFDEAVWKLFLPSAVTASSNVNFIEFHRVKPILKPMTSWFLNNLEPGLRARLSKNALDFIIEGPSVPAVIMPKILEYLSKEESYVLMQEMLNQILEKKPEIFLDVLTGLEAKAAGYGAMTWFLALNYVSYLIDFVTAGFPQLPLAAQRIIQAKDIVQELLQYPHRLGYKNQEIQGSIMERQNSLARKILIFARESREENFSDLLESEFHPEGIRLERVLAFPDYLRKKLLNNRIARLNGKKDTRRKVVILYSKSDYNGALENLNIFKAFINNDFNILYYEIHGATEVDVAEQIVKALKDATQDSQGEIDPADILIFGAHGFVQTMDYGVDFTVAMEEFLHSVLGETPYVKDGGYGLLNSCLTGRGREMTYNWANVMAKLFPQVQEWFAPEDESFLDDFDLSEGIRVTHADYQRDRGKVQVPTYRAIPKKQIQLEQERLGSQDVRQDIVRVEFSENIEGTSHFVKSIILPLGGIKDVGEVMDAIRNTLSPEDERMIFRDDKLNRGFDLLVNGISIKYKYFLIRPGDQVRIIKDEAMVSLQQRIGAYLKKLQSEKRSTGGIDLTPANNVLQTQNNGGEIKFHMDPAMLKQLQNAPGFVPVIISIQPMVNLRVFLGLKESNEKIAGV